MKCERCDWDHDPELPVKPREQLADHAGTSGHPLCVLCHRSLRDDELQTCEVPREARGGALVESCLTRTRVLLSGVISMYMLDAPGQLGQLRGSRYDDTRPGGGTAPLPGGDLLVLLGGGSQGLSDDGLTVEDDDPSSVAFDLGFWEDTWRRALAEPRERGSHRPRVIVRQAAGYLERRMRWASREHPGFLDFHDDLRLLHDRLALATGRSQPRVRAEAECFGCGADALERKVTDGGYSDVWTCRRCGQTYDWKRYLLALGSHLRLSAQAGWCLPEHAAYALGVSPKTVRGWTRPGPSQVTTACVIGDRRLRVWWEDARRRAEQLREQKQRREERRRQEARSA